MRVPVADLPKPSFRKVDDDLSRRPTSTVDVLARGFGYHGGETLDIPQHYIRHVEPLESDLMKQVEYDMDEQDYDWLQLLNAERKKEGAGPVSPEIFEVIMDQLEKEWFTLMKRVPKPDMDLPAEDSCCAICDDGEGENSNAIVFCDGCNLAVHQDCYGVPYIPEGQWLCRKCTVSPEVPVGCVLCPNEGGAFKQTSSGKWAHLLCAIWIPEVTVQSQVFMEPIEHIENISKSRWKLRCSICKEPRGACIQCDIKSCYTAFHVSCARKQKLLCSMKTLPGQDEQPLRSYCERHLPPEMAESRNRYLKDREERAEEIERLRQSSKAARAYARTYKTGAPLVPQYIVNRVMEYLGRVIPKKQVQVVLAICKYWSLKREARRGAPLLKRLHLEPWSTPTSAAQQTEEFKRRKLEYLKRLRQVLLTLRERVSKLKEHEFSRAQRTESVVDSLGKLLFPHEAALREAFQQISGLDENHYFRVAPSKADNPEYYEKVQTPMSWQIINEKLDTHDYWDPSVFRRDIECIWENMLISYPPEHEVYLQAARLKERVIPILETLSAIPKVDGPDLIGSFEPAIDVVKTLLKENETENSEKFLALTLSDLGTSSAPWVNTLVQPNVRVGTGKPLSTRLRPPNSNSAAAVVEGTAQLMANGRERTTSPKKRGSKSPRKNQKPSAKGGTVPITEASLRRHTTATSGGTGRTLDDAPSIAGSERKRKRDEYEATGVDADKFPSREDDGMDKATASPRRKTQAVEGGDYLPKALTKSQKKEIARQKERERRARKKAEAAAVSTSVQENMIESPISEGPTAAGRIAGSSSPLTEIEELDAATDAGGEYGEWEIIPEEGRKLAKPKARRDRRPQPHRKPSRMQPRRNPTGGSTKNEKKEEKELPVGYILQVGPGQRQTHKQNDRPRKEDLLGDPPELDSRGLIEGGTLVWAKQEGHPWFPGVVFEPDDEEIPTKIHQTKEWFCSDAKLTEEERGQVQIVRFFDRQRTWAWLAPRSIRLLFVDKKRDDFLLNQRFKSQTLRTQVKEAFNRAEYEKEIEPEVQPQAEEGKEPAPSFAEEGLEEKPEEATDEAMAETLQGEA